MDAVGKMIYNHVHFFNRNVTIKIDVFLKIAVSNSRRGSASDLAENISAAFSLLSFLPLSKSISMENLKNDVRAVKGKEA